VSFIPLVGPLISCIIDGTFVDMIKALSTGDWATLGMCALAFVPGGKALKGLKAFGAIEKTGIKANRVAGKTFEKQVIGKLGLDKGGRLAKQPGMKTYRVADAFDKAGNPYEIKHVGNLRVTDQIRDELRWAQANKKTLHIAYDPSWTENADVFAERLSKDFDPNSFRMVPVIP
jgi:hypothetical protein